MADPTRRFSDCVDDYARYRPGYPIAVADHLRHHCGALPGSAIADLGSGTGKLTELLLGLGCRVHAVEPNEHMREAAAERLRSVPGFVSVAGRAEATGLPDACIDLATAAQAFHWFEPKATHRELERILRPHGRLAVIWNDRDPRNDFTRDYDALVSEYSLDYRAVHRSRRTVEELANDLLVKPERIVVPNPQPPLTREALIGRYRSASYSLKPDHPRYPEARRELYELYDRYAGAGGICVSLVTVVIWGKLSSPRADTGVC